MRNHHPLTHPKTEWDEPSSEEQKMRIKWKSIGFIGAGMTISILSFGSLFLGSNNTGLPLAEKEYNPSSSGLGLALGEQVHPWNDEPKSLADNPAHYKQENPTTTAKPTKSDVSVNSVTGSSSSSSSSGSSSSFSHPPSSSGQQMASWMISANFTPTGDPDQLKTFLNHSRRYQEVHIAGAKLDENGQVHVPAFALNAASSIRFKNRNILIFPTVDMSEHSVEVHDFLFSSPARKEAVQQLTRLATDGSYHGINLQLNALDPSDRKIFASWVTDLANQLHRNGKLLCLSFKPQLFHLELSTSDPVLARIGKAADQIKLIALNYPDDRPAPSSTISWLNKVLENSAKQIPPAKLHLDLPLSGAHWVDNTLEEFLSENQVLHLLTAIGGEPERDANGELHTVFHMLGVTHTVYCQDEETVRFKTEAIRKNKQIAGIFTDDAQEGSSELPGLLSELLP